MVHWRNTFQGDSSRVLSCAISTLYRYRIVNDFGLWLFLLSWELRSWRLALSTVGTIALVGLGVAVNSFFTCWSYERYEELKQDVAWEKYPPFEPNNKLVKVNVLDTQRIGGALPWIDGAYAFYPVYAAAMQAICSKKSNGERVRTDGSDRTFKKLSWGGEPI